MTKDRPGEGSRDQGISRRRLIQLVGAVGTTAVASACSRMPMPSANSVATTAYQASPLATTSPSTTAVAMPPPVSVSAQADLLCRDTWGARPPFPGGRPHTITRMTIHHTAVTLGENRNITSRLRQHQRYHQDVKGWVDIAYHVGVDRDGNIFELRRTEIAGDTATDYDTRGHFLVVCEGNFDEEPISEEQLNGAALAFAWASQKFAVTSSTLASHQQVTPTTACPGINLQARVDSGDLRSRIDELLAGGQVNLEPLCLPQASDMVAAIEAGR